MKKYDGTLVATYLILERDGKILLLRRHNTGWHDGDYSLIAGHVNLNEPAIQTIIREAKEEAGIIIQKKDLEFVHVAHRDRTPDNNEYIDFYFKTKRWQGKLKKGPSCDQLAWFSPNNLPKNVIPVVRNILKSIQSGSYYSEHGWKK